MEIKIPDELIENIVTFLISTPKVLVAIVFSWVSGHLWSYVLFTYFRDKTKSIGFFDGWMGKASLGILWFALIIVPINYMVNDTFNIEYENILKVIYSVVLYGFVLQAFIFICLTLFKRG